MTVRTALAAADGWRVLVLGACCELGITVGPLAVSCAHDDDCPALDPFTPEGLAARALADEAVLAVLDQLGIRAAAVMVEEDR